MAVLAGVALLRGHDLNHFGQPADRRFCWSASWFRLGKKLLHLFQQLALAHQLTGQFAALVVVEERLVCEFFELSDFLVAPGQQPKSVGGRHTPILASPRSRGTLAGCSTMGDEPHKLETYLTCRPGPISKVFKVQRDGCNSTSGRRALPRLRRRR
jgi:hypothetical protein